jgi:hypothetical protein
VVVRLWEGLEEDHEEVPVVVARWLEEQEPAIGQALGRKVLPVVSRRSSKLRVRMARVLQNRKGWVEERRYVVVVSHQPQL